MKKLLELCGILLILLNSVGGIIAGIWLAFLGAWGTIGWGLAFVFGGTFAIGLALMPSLLFVAPMIGLTKRGWHVSAMIVGAANTTYTFAVMTAWCVLAFVFFGSRIGDDAALPYLVWAYFAATSPITYMASKENNEYSALTALISQIAFILAIVFSAAITNLFALVVLVVIMGLGLLLQLFVAYTTWRSERQFADFIGRLDE